VTLQPTVPTYTISDRALGIYKIATDVFDWSNNNECVTPMEVARKQFSGANPKGTVCIPGAGIGTYIVAALEAGFHPSDITAVEIVPAHYEIGNAIYRRFGVNYVLADFLEWNPQMQFDYVIGNPPYSDMRKHNGGGGGGSSKNLDSVFFDRSREIGTHVSLIMRSKHFTRMDSVFRRKLFGSGKVVSISYVPKEFFPTIKNTETCIVTWSDSHSGPTKITYKNGEVVEKELTSSTVIKLNNPDFIFEVENNLVHRYLNGGLIRRKFEDGDCPIVEICGTGETPVIKYIKEGLEDTARNCWGVVINYSTAWGSLGRVMLKPYEASISHSVICLKTDTEEEAVALRDYLLTDDVKKMVADNMPSFHATKEMFRKIPDPFTNVKSTYVKP
jgi:predicted RNA methylase